MGDKTKIDWCDASWNPVTGCLHGCEYCYARGIANRFGLPYAPKLGDPGMEGAAKWDSSEGMDTMLELEKPYVKDGRKQPYPMGFLPTFHKYRLDEPQRWTKPRTIFVCSMADLFGEWVPDEWIKEVFDACRRAPQHRYLFLTKNPARYGELAAEGKLPKEKNHWYGITATDHQMAEANFRHIPNGWDGYNIFLSAEPLHGEINIPALNSWPKWVIFGAQTGNCKDKVVPKKEWIENAVAQCRLMGVPVFMKESLRQLMGADFVQEYPWQAYRNRKEAKRDA
ncbi:MAG: DUF5131 family protein [Clostridia bacterium]|nr:DUF5131 family protein [Clostridia bacterium]MBR4537233.1 DUF5131 family protein [Clostridia bacterium]